MPEPSRQVEERQRYWPAASTSRGVSAFPSHDRRRPGFPEPQPLSFSLTHLEVSTRGFLSSRHWARWYLQCPAWQFLEQ